MPRSTPRRNYRRLRSSDRLVVRHKFIVARRGRIACVRAVGVGMGSVKQQFFPTSDRPEVLVEVQMPEGTSIEATSAAAKKVEDWLQQQPEAKIVTSYIGQGAPASSWPIIAGIARSLLRQDRRSDA